MNRVDARYEKPGHSAYFDRPEEQTERPKMPKLLLQEQNGVYKENPQRIRGEPEAPKTTNSSPSPGLSGTRRSFGQQSFGNWNDGTRWTNQNLGGTQFDPSSRQQDDDLQLSAISESDFTNCQ